VSVAVARRARALAFVRWLRRMRHNEGYTEFDHPVRNLERESPEQQTTGSMTRIDGPYDLLKSHLDPESVPGLCAYRLSTLFKAEF